VLEAAHTKLSKYYSKTEDEHSNFYNFSNILDLSFKITTYDSNDWDPDISKKYRVDIMTITTLAMSRRYHHRQHKAVE
jgi:hypothetical protein